MPEEHPGLVIHPDVGDVHPEKDFDNVVAPKATTATSVVDPVPTLQEQADAEAGKEAKPPEASLKDCFRYATPQDKVMLAVGCFFAVVQGAVWPIFSILLGEVMDSFGSNFTVQQTVDLVNEQALYFFFVGVASWISGIFQLGFFMHVAESMSYQFKVHAVKNALQQEYGYFESKKTGELAAAVMTDANAITRGLGEKLSNILQLMVTMAGGLAVGVWKGYHVALVVIGLGPLIGGVMAFMSVILTRGADEVKKAYLGANSTAEEYLRGIKTIVSFNAQLSGMRKYSEGLLDAAKAGRKFTMATGLSIAGLQASFNLMYAIALWFGLWLVREGIENDITGEVYTGGQVLAAYFGVVIAAMTAGQLGPDMMEVVKARAAVYRLLEIVDRPSQSVPLGPVDDAAKPLVGQISFKDVSFAYPRRLDVEVLSELNIDIPAGSTVAFVGASGSGKSTIAKLVDRVYDVQKGSVTIDGVDVRAMDIRKLRSQVGMVNQEPVLISGTFADNIRFGVPKDKASAVTRKDVIAAAKLARAHEFIMDNGGYDADIGAGGGQLSGGQKQRISIARVVLVNPTILLLDEATSALDYHSEKQVAEALQELMMNKTTLLVAHRLSTVQNADCIFVMKNGRIIQQGTYDAMMKQEGPNPFAELVEKQVIAESEQKNNNDGDDVKQQQAQDKESATRTRAASSVGGVKASEGKDDEKQDEEKKEPVPDHTKDLLNMMSTSEKWLLLPCTLFAIMGASLQPGFAVAFGEMVKLFYETDHDKSRDGAWLWAGIFVAMAVVVAVGEIGKSAIVGKIGENIVMKLRRTLFLSFMRQDMSYFESAEMTVSVIASRLGSEADLCKAGSIGVVGDIMGLATVFITAFLIAFLTSWKLTLALLGTVPFLMAASAYQMKMLSGFGAVDEDVERQSSELLHVAFNENLTVLLFNRQATIVSDLAEMLHPSLKQAHKRAIKAGFGFGLSNAMMLWLYSLCFFVGGILFEEDNLPFGDIMIVLFAIAMIGWGSNNYTANLSKVQDAKLAMHSIFKVLQTESDVDPFPELAYGEIVEGPVALSSSSSNNNNSKGVAVTPVSYATLGGDDVKSVSVDFKHVSFAYKALPDHPVLRDFSLHVTANTSVALVGPSGSGKSTVHALLNRFYGLSDQVEGKRNSIQLNQVETTALSVRELRNRIRWVQQEPILMDDSIYNNIVMGFGSGATSDALDAQRELPSEEEYKRACEMANAWEFIESLPEGRHTEVGPKGLQVSGGQKQRIAIARALIGRPSVLLLDEATSALDANAEQLVQDAIDKIMARKEMTIIVIAHRLSTVKTCDQIAYLEGGSIKEQGTHDELMSKGGLYAAMAKDASKEIP